MRLSDQHGATGWILRSGKTLADVNGSVASAMKRREIFQVGTDSDGIGVPLQGDGRTIGVLLVQSYKANIKYSQQDLAGFLYYPVAIIMSASLLLIALGVFIKLSGSIVMEHDA
jgi:hypothetical protein